MLEDKEECEEEEIAKTLIAEKIQRTKPEMKITKSYNMDEIREDALNELIEQHTKEVDKEESLAVMKESKDEEIEIAKTALEVSRKLHIVEKNSLRKENDKIVELAASCASMLEHLQKNEGASQSEFHYAKKEIEAFNEKNNKSIKKL